MEENLWECGYRETEGGRDHEGEKEMVQRRGIRVLNVSSRRYSR